MTRLHRLLAGQDGAGRRALPLGEFLHPAPLVALMLLGANDHWLKFAHLVPHWLTGKISDFAGLFFFPLLMTAVGDCLLLVVARLTGRRIDFSLRRWKLTLACAATAAVAIPLELSTAFGNFYVVTLGKIGFPSATYQDVTDLFALVMLPLAYWLGLREIRRVPLGRIEVIVRRFSGRSPSAGEVAVQLRDVRTLSNSLQVDALAAALVAWLPARDDAAAKAAVDTALGRVREAG